MFQRFLLLTALAVTAGSAAAGDVALAGPAQVSSGRWHVFPVCTVSLGTPDRAFNLHHLAAGQRIVLQASRGSWRFDPPTEVPLRFGVDDAELGRATGSAAGDRVEWNIGPALMRDLERLQPGGRVLRIVFGGDVAGTWTIALGSLSDASGDLARCLRALDAGGSPRIPRTPDQPPSALEMMPRR